VLNDIYAAFEPSTANCQWMLYKRVWESSKGNGYRNDGCRVSSLFVKIVLAITRSQFAKVHFMDDKGEHFIYVTDKRLREGRREVQINTDVDQVCFPSMCCCVLLLSAAFHRRAEA